MKRLLLILIIMLAVVPLSTSAYGDSDEPPGDYREVFDLVNQDLEEIVEYPDYFQEENEAGRPFNESLLNSRQVIVYGEPHGDFTGGNHRYLGYTMRNEESFTNVKFPHDSWAGGYIEDRNWIDEPWDDEDVIDAHGIEENQFDKNDEYRKEILPYIQEGMIIYYGIGTVDEEGNIKQPGPRAYKGADSEYHDKWHDYVHILQPPTRYTWGMGRMFHEREDGSIWYLTVPITKTSGELPDVNLKAEITSAPEEAEPGDEVELEGEISSEYDEMNTRLIWEVNGNIEKEKEITVDDSQAATLSFTMPEENAEIALEVNPDRDMPEYETTFEDNRDTVEINAEGVNENDLAVEIVDSSDEVMAGNSANVSGKLTSITDEPITTVVQWRVDGSVDYESQVTFQEERDLNYSFVMPEDYADVELEVNPDHNMPEDEITFENNIDKATVTEAMPDTPSTNGNLQLTAKSQGGKDRYGNYQPPENRTPGTAKWGDIVTANLDMPQSPPDRSGNRYRLIHFKVQNATIEYPKKHPDFTFGSPVEPIETTIQTMNITGDRTAQAQFEEDWSLNGADVHDRLNNQDVPGPTNYDIKATYEIEWKYQTRTRKWSPLRGFYWSSWRTHTKNLGPYTESAQLLVNGAGRLPQAH